MPKEKQFLVRTSDGKMRTVVSTSIRAAGAKAMSKFKLPNGEIISVKERGVGDWNWFEVKR